VFPFREVAKSRDIAAMTASFSGGTAHPSEESKKRQEELWEMATLSYFYRHEMLRHWPLVLAALVIPPAVVYGLVRGVVAITTWVLRGFRS
jgi:hypothetical protein